MASLLLNVNDIDTAILQGIDRSEYDLMKDKDVTIYNIYNKEIYTNRDTTYLNMTTSMLTEVRTKGYMRYNEGDYKIVAMYLNRSGKNVVVTAGAIDLKGKELLSKARTGLFFTLVLAGLVTLIMGWFFVGRALAPIKAIIQKVRNLLAGRALRTFRAHYRAR